MWENVTKNWDASTLVPAAGGLPKTIAKQHDVAKPKMIAKQHDVAKPKKAKKVSLKQKQIPSLPNRVEVMQPERGLCSMAAMWRSALEKDSFVVIRDHLPEDRRTAVMDCIVAHVRRWVPSAGDMKENNDVLQSLSDVPCQQWMKTPPDWGGPRWGAKHQLGWMMLGGFLKLISKGLVG